MIDASDAALAVMIAQAKARRWGAMTNAEVLDQVRNSTEWRAIGGPMSRGKNRKMMLMRMRVSEVQSWSETAAAYGGTQ